MSIEHLSTYHLTGSAFRSLCTIAPPAGWVLTPKSRPWHWTQVLVSRTATSGKCINIQELIAVIKKVEFMNIKVFGEFLYLSFILFLNIDGNVRIINGDHMHSLVIY